MAAWAHHRCARNSIIGIDGAAWLWADRDRALVLAASYPSGYETVVSARGRVRQALCASPWPAATNAASTSLRHLKGSGDVITADEVYIGATFDNYPPSPWQSLEDFDVLPVLDYEEYAMSRADLDEWLDPLRGRVMVCDCNLTGRPCHGAVLLDIILDGEDADLEYEDCEGEEDADLEYEDCADLVGYGSNFGDINFELDYLSKEAGSVINETLRGAPASNLRFTDEWRWLIAHIRSFRVKLFWEVFAGCCIANTAVQEAGFPTAPPVDIILYAWMDLLNPIFLYVVLGVVLEKRFFLIWLGPPCASFSMAVNRFVSHCMRTRAYPNGLPHLDSGKQDKVRMGNALRDVAVTIAVAQDSTDEDYLFEQPGSSIMLDTPEVREMEKTTKATRAMRDQCVDGAPWKKTTALVSNNPVIAETNARCTLDHDHVVLEGMSPEGVPWTKVASAYWPQFARSAVEPLLRCRRLTEVPENSGWNAVAVAPPGDWADPAALLAQGGLCPSGHRHAQSVATVVSSGVQPTKQGLPQLVPDYLRPEMHVRIARSLQHPFQLRPSVHPAIRKSCDEQPASPKVLNDARLNAMDACVALANVLTGETKFLLGKCHRYVAKVLRSGGLTKNVALHRELVYVARVPDLMAVPQLLIGSRMLGRSLPIYTMPTRVVEPLATMEEFLDRREATNEKVMRLASKPIEAELSHASWQKSVAEEERGVLLGPYPRLADLPYQEPSLCWRKPVWERHGGAFDWEVRNIDDMLVAEQNETAAYQSTHIPMTVDAVATQTRTAQEAFPEDELAGFSSDFAKAYKQVPGAPQQAERTVLAQWSPPHRQIMFWIAMSLLFGGRLAPLGFARYPALIILLTAVLFALGFQHCVDDLLCVERKSTADGAHQVWMRFTKLLGWDVPFNKSPYPSQCFIVVGIQLDLAPFPLEPAEISITELRLESLEEALQGVAQTQRLTPAFASKLYGRLNFACTQMWGRTGRARLKAFLRRIYERRDNYNMQIATAVAWWLAFLRDYRPRPVPLVLRTERAVVTYSDGEGTDAGVGIAIWHDDDRPRAAYLSVHTEIRRAWSAQRALQLQTEEFSDIFCVEAVGPLAIITTWPQLLRGRLWLHFIDNTSAQSALVRGASSVHAGDVIVGHTWMAIAREASHFWCDRVCSKSNPIDGVSRRRWEGPWACIEPAKLPNAMLTDLSAFRRLSRSFDGASEGTPSAAFNSTSMLFSR